MRLLKRSKIFSGGLYPKFKRVHKKHQKNKTALFHIVRWLWCWKQRIEKMERRTLRGKSAWNKKCLRASHKNNCVETGQIRCAPLACTLTNCCTILSLKQMRIKKLHISVKKMISNTPKLLGRGSTIGFLLSSLLKGGRNRDFFYTQAPPVVPVTNMRYAIQIRKTFLIKCLLYYWIIASKSQFNCAWV